MPKRIWKRGTGREKSLRKSARRMAQDWKRMLQTKNPVSIGALAAQHNFFAGRPPKDRAVLQAEFVKTQKKNVFPKKRKPLKSEQFTNQLKACIDRMSQTIPELDRFEVFLDNRGSKPAPRAIRKAEQELQGIKNRLAKIFQASRSASRRPTPSLSASLARRIQVITIDMLQQISHSQETVEHLKKKLEIN